MPEFVMDGAASLEFRELDYFVQGYIESIFFTETEMGTDRDIFDPKAAEEGQSSQLPGDYGIHDLAPVTLADIVADCEQWQEANVALLEKAYATGYDEAQAGRDYWFTRNGHGVGFWDRKELEGEIGEALSDACRHNQVDVYLGDDGLVYI